MHHHVHIGGSRPPRVDRRSHRGEQRHHEQREERYPPGSSRGLDVPGLVVIANDSIAANGDVSGSTPMSTRLRSMSRCRYVRDVRLPDHEQRNIEKRVSRIQLVGASYPVVSNNAIFANELGKATQRYNIRLDDGFGGEVTGMIDARQNYWGAAYRTRWIPLSSGS